MKFLNRSKLELINQKNPRKKLGLSLFVYGMYTVTNMEEACLEIATTDVYLKRGDVTIIYIHSKFYK